MEPNKQDNLIEFLPPNLLTNDVNSSESNSNIISTSKESVVEKEEGGIL